MIMACFLFLVTISVTYHAYCTHVQWKKRRDEEINAEIARNKRQSIQMQEGYKVIKVVRENILKFISIDRHVQVN